MDSSIVYKIIEMVGAFLAGGGLWAVIKAKVDKKKTPYEMFMELMQEQRKFQEQMINALLIGKSRKRITRISFLSRYINPKLTVLKREHKYSLNIILTMLYEQ